MSGAFFRDFSPIFGENAHFFVKNSNFFCELKKSDYLCIRKLIKTDGPIAENDMETLKYTSREINQNYKIKVSGIFEGQKINTLVGVSGLCRIIDDIALTNRLLDRAFDCMDDKCICKLRRGIKISFYAA